MFGLIRVAACGLVVSSCSAAETGGGSMNPVGPRAPTETYEEGSVRWHRLPMGAGGLVTGLAVAAADSETVVYARTDVGGAYRWDAEHSEWEQLLRPSRLRNERLGPGDSSVLSVAVAPSNADAVYVAVGNDFNPRPDSPLNGSGRVLRSTDGGQTWLASDQRWLISGTQEFRSGTERLAVHPTDPSVVAFGTQREGLWISIDGGSSWSQVSLTDVPAGTTSDVTADQAGVSSVAFGTDGDGIVLIVGVTGTGIFMSRDLGQTWDLHHELVPGEWPGAAQFSGSDLVVAVNSGAEPGRGPEQGRLVRVTPAGESHEVDVPRSAAMWNLAIDPSDPDNWVLTDEAVRDGHLWSSSDGGQSWREHDIRINADEIPWLGMTDLEEWMTVGRLVFDPTTPDRVWFAEGMGVWITGSTNQREVEWTLRSRGIEELVVSDIVVPPDSAPIVITADRQGFLIDPAFERYPTATLVDEGFASGARLDFSVADPSVLAWVGAQSNIASSPNRQPRGAVSRDGGLTWSEMGGMDQDMYGGEIAVSAVDPDTMIWRPSSPFLADDGNDPYLGLRISDDGGRSWRSVDVDGGVDSFHRYFWWFVRRSLTSDRVDEAFYLMSDDERLYVSRDGGANWDQAAFSPPCSTVSNCHVFGQLRAAPGKAGELWASTGTSGLHRTTDAGRTPWEELGHFAEVLAFGFGAPALGTDDATIFVHAREPKDENLALWWSVDDGASWERLTEAPFDLATGITAVAGDPGVHGRVYVGFTGNGAVVGDIDSTP